MMLAGSADRGGGVTATVNAVTPCRARSRMG